MMTGTKGWCQRKSAVRRGDCTRVTRHTAKTGVTLASTIAATLRKQLADGAYQAGDRFPSQNELAVTFQTSTVSVREAVLLLVQEGLLERRFGSGTYATGRRPELFVAVISELDLAHPATSPSFLVTMQAARRCLAQQGIQSRVYMGHSAPFGEESPLQLSSWDFLHDLEAGRISGVIAVATIPWLVECPVGQRPIPIVNGCDIDGVPFWHEDDLVRLGVKVLAEKQCRRVACIKTGTRPHTLGLFDRFTALCAESGLTTRPEWLKAVPFAHEHGDGVAAFQAVWQSHAEKPDGLLVLDDVLYRDLAYALIVNGIRVPQDLVVVSHANAPDARPMRPEPVRLVLDNERFGAALAQNLMNRMKDPAAKPVGIPLSLEVVEPVYPALDALLVAATAVPSPVIPAGRRATRRHTPLHA